MADRPIRIQLSRKKGFRLQEVSKAANGLDVVSVARPSKWGNPYKILCPAYGMREAHFDRENAVRMFKNLYEADIPEMRGLPSRLEVQTELRGKNLACYCPLDGPCHANILLEMAND